MLYTIHTVEATLLVYQEPLSDPANDDVVQVINNLHPQTMHFARVGSYQPTESVLKIAIITDLESMYSLVAKPILTSQVPPCSRRR